MACNADQKLIVKHMQMTSQTIITAACPNSKKPLLAPLLPPFNLIDSLIPLRCCFRVIACAAPQDFFEGQSLLLLIVHLPPNTKTTKNLQSFTTYRPPSTPS